MQRAWRGRLASESAHPSNCGYVCRQSGSVSLLKAIVVATNAVATHAMTIDATAQAERASAWSSSVTDCRIAAGMLSRTRSINLPKIIALFCSIGAPGSVSCAVCQPPYLDGGLETSQHQAKVFQHGQLATVLGEDDGGQRLRSHK